MPTCQGRSMLNVRCAIDMGGKGKPFRCTVCLGSTAGECLPSEALAVPSRRIVLSSSSTIWFSSESKQETVPVLSINPSSMSFCVIAYSPLQVTFADCGHSPVKNRTPRGEQGNGYSRKATGLPNARHSGGIRTHAASEVFSQTKKQCRRRSREYVSLQ